MGMDNSTHSCHVVGSFPRPDDVQKLSFEILIHVFHRESLRFNMCVFVSLPLLSVFPWGSEPFDIEEQSGFHRHTHAWFPFFIWSSIKMNEFGVHQ